MRGLLIIAIVLMAWPAHAPAQEVKVSSPVAESRVAHLADRLAALTPDQPRAYFELGEEVASEASDAGDRHLARQLYVLAMEITRRSKQPDAALSSSVCLALAAIAETDDERRWLTALADTLAPDGEPDPRRIKTSTASRDPSAFDLATMLSFVRTGEGRRAAKILDKPGVSQLLDKCDNLLLPGLGGAALVRRHIDEWPICPQCRNHRIIKDGTGIHLCPNCGGLPGPKLPIEELIGEIRTESMLLSGQQRSWAGQITSDDGSPLRELDPSEVAATYKVDPLRPLWRDGRWGVDPNALKVDPKDGPKADAKPDAPGAAAPAARGKRIGR